MNWDKGYSSSYYMTIIDPLTWRDVRRVEISSGQINRDLEGLRESASVECREDPQGIEQWIRLWFDSDQDGDTEHIPLFTGLATTPTTDINGRITSKSIECYSVLKPASDIYLLRGWYAQAGRRGGEVIRELLSVVPSPVYISEDSPILENHIVAEDSETYLSMIEKILSSMYDPTTGMYWRLRISGDGSIYVEPFSLASQYEFDPLEFDVVEANGIRITEDWFSCPNVYMAIYDDITAIARDDDENSPLSVPSRGREVWLQESGVNLSDGITIEEYAYLRLQEAQRAQQIVSYTRRFVPDLYPGDCVIMHYPEQSIIGRYRIQSQSIDMSYSPKVNEEVVYEQ